MPCITQPNLTPSVRQSMDAAIKRLEAALALANGSGIKLVVGPTGSVAFKGWTDRAGVSDMCAYRALAAANSPALRKAVARAEAMAGRMVDSRAVAAGVHSHDGGGTWHPGH